jgi:hypothetical protein
MPQDLQTALIAATTISAVVVLAWAVWSWTTRRDPVPLLLVIGTQLAAPYEPLGDALLHVYYPESGQVGFLDVFGRQIPLFVELLYVPYIVPFVLLFTNALRSGISKRTWWLTWSALLAGTAIMEMVVLQAGKAWTYYGPQQFVVAGVPVWVALTNVTFLFLIAAGVRTITAKWGRGHWWTIAPATALLLAAGHAVVATPTALALHAGGSAQVVRVAMLASLAVAVVTSWQLSRHLTARSGTPSPLTSSNSPRS